MPKDYGELLRRIRIRKGLNLDTGELMTPDELEEYDEEIKLRESAASDVKKFYKRIIKDIESSGAKLVNADADKWGNPILDFEVEDYKKFSKIALKYFSKREIISYEPGVYRILGKAGDKPFAEATAKELVDGSNRGQNPFDPRKSTYRGFSFRSKLAYFRTGKWEQKVRLDDLKIISRLKGDDTDKVSLALESDLEVHCTCPDWKFGGFQYIGTQLGYATNKENRPPDIRNPQQEGTICKHLTYLMENIQKHTPAIAHDVNVSRQINYRSVMHEEIDKLIADVRGGETAERVLESAILEEIDKDAVHKAAKKVAVKAFGDEEDDKKTRGAADKAISLAKDTEDAIGIVQGFYSKR